MAWARYPDKKLYKDSNNKNVRTDCYQDLPPELWNSTTVMTYLDYLNTIHYKKPPTTTNARLTRIRIEGDLTKYGGEVIKTWMELAIKEWGGSTRFPTASYMQLRQFKWDGFIDKAVAKVGLATYEDPLELSDEELDQLF